MSRLWSPLLSFLGRGSHAAGPAAAAPLLYFSVALLGGCGAPDGIELGRRQLPIVNGTASGDSFLPGIGALVVSGWWGGQTFCSGTLISDQLVLTAAHCLEQFPAGMPLGFAIGANAAGGKVLAVASTQIHPSYKGGQPPGTLADYYDIAVMRLKQPTTVAQPIKMVRPKEVGSLLKYGAPLLIVGYGMTNPNNQSSSGVKYHGTSTLADVGKSEIWVYDKDKPQKCNGDSGGPTLADADAGAATDWRVVGVASRAGEGCTYGSVETRVDVYLSWIHGFGAIPCGSGQSADCGSQPPPPPPPPPPAKKELGEACAIADDCKGSLCISAGSGQPMMCSQLCALGASACPSGFACAPIQGSKDGACVRASAPPPPTKKGLGEGCSASDECESGTCGAAGEARFCTRQCTPEAGCGVDTMECVAAGESGFACAPRGAAPADPGSTGGGGCSVAGGDPVTASILGLIVIAIALGARRRSRRGVIACSGQTSYQNSHLSSDRSTE